MYDIILGRSPPDSEKYGKKGTVFIGKQYVQMGQTSSLSNPIYLDVARAHAMLIVGKRGGGKSYTMGSIAEGLADMDHEIAKNLSFVLLDTMGVYWSMKYPNKKEEDFLKKWGLEAKGLDVQIFVPGGFYQKYKEDGVPVDFPFYIQPKELAIEDWMNAFKLKTDDPVGVGVQRVVNKLIDSGKNFDIEDIVEMAQKDERLDTNTKLAVITRFENAKTWGIFSKNATPMKNVLIGGKVSVLDFSPYVAMPGGWEVKALALGIFAKKIFVERMLVRKKEELLDIVNRTQVIKKGEVEEDLPMPWLIIDECLTYDSLIRTNLGDIKIGEIVKNNKKYSNLEVLSYNEEKSAIEYKKIKKTFNQGIKEIIELKSISNLKLKCTPEHKIYTKIGFVEAKEAENIAIPIKKDYLLDKKSCTARLIGHIYGDGWLSFNQVGFSSNLVENLELIKRDLDILGFKSDKIFIRNTKSSFKNINNKVIEIIGNSKSFKSSKRAFEYFSNLDCHLGSKVNNPTFIPNYILNSSKEEKAQFLSTLFGADSNIPSQAKKWKSDFNPLRLVFYRREDLEKEGIVYAKQIKKLLLELGIKVSSIKKRNGNIRIDNTKSIRFEITIAKEINNMIKFYEKIGYAYEIRKEKESIKWLHYLKYKKYSLTEKEKIRKKAMKLKKENGWGKIRISKFLGVSDYQIRDWIYYNRKSSLPWSFPSYKTWVEENCNDNLIFERIVSKRKVNPEETYDIEIEKNHNFFANNFLVHNCHEFLPAGDEEAPSKKALMTILREGRQPGVSIIMATQQPAKIHTDAITQSDIVLAHRLTASFDLEALDKVFLSYDSKGSKSLFNSMPRVKGCAIIMDDKNERLHTMQIKPRFTWHGGEDPNAIRQVKDEFDFD